MEKANMDMRAGVILFNIVMVVGMVISSGLGYNTENCCGSETGENR
jgi:hypothetical protein